MRYAHVLGPLLSRRAMPLNQYSQAETNALIVKLDPALTFLLDELDISGQVQANLAARRITRLGVFAKLEPTEEAFRLWLKNDLGFDPASGVEERVEAAKLVEAWDAARQRSETSRKLEAEAKVQGVDREMLKGTHLALRRAHVRVHGPVDDRKCPGRAYLEARLEQLDDGELEAEPLTKVTTVAMELATTAASTDSNLGIRRDGVVHVVKGRRTAPLPTGPEQLRDVLRVMARHWSMVHLKGAGRLCLRDFEMRIFEEHTDYLLGDDCYRLTEANPGIRANPSWELLLAYEHELRKAAIKNVSENGVTLAEALKAARESSDHRTKHFITPLALQGPSSSAGCRSSQPGDGSRGDKRGADGQQAGDSGAPPRKQQKGDGKGKGKDAGKQKGKDHGKSSTGPSGRYKQLRNKARQLGLNFVTPEKQLICHNYGAQKCTVQDCPMAHVCAKCYGPHPLTECPQMAGR